MKKDITEILKNGVNFEFKSIDMKSEKVREAFKKAREAQEKSLKRKEVDWEKLSKFVINI